MAEPSQAFARELDRVDPLAGFRDRFVIDDPAVAYLDGNSLGRLPGAAREAVVRVLEEEWGVGLVESWEHWIDLPQRVGARLAPLIGAGPDQVTLADSTSVNLFKLAAAALDARPGRTAVVTDSDNFPTDRYVIEGLAASRGLQVKLVDVDPAAGPDPDSVARVLDRDVALISFSHVSYRSGAIADMAAVCDLAREAGALTLWDLSHAAGSIPIDLDGAGADLAVGCTYKYLNGGPGAPAFQWVRPELLDRLLPPIRGWFAHADQFAFAAQFRPADGIARFLVGTPPILAVAAAAVGIDLVVEAGIESIRTKSLQATGMMLEYFDTFLAPLGIGLGSPRRPERRGSHLAFRHPDGLAISRWLRRTAGVVVDFRAPDTIRMAVAPLYTTYLEVWDALEALRDAVASGRYREAASGGTVT